MTKTEIREWLKRIREDCREIEYALREGDWDIVVDLANDASGAAGEIVAGLEDEPKWAA